MQLTNAITNLKDSDPLTFTSELAAYNNAEQYFKADKREDLANLIASEKRISQHLASEYATTHEPADLSSYSGRLIGRLI